MSLRALLLRLILSLVLVANGSAWAMAPLRGAPASTQDEAAMARSTDHASADAMPCHDAAAPTAGHAKGAPDAAGSPGHPLPAGCGEHCTCTCLAHALLLPAPVGPSASPPRAVAFAPVGHAHAPPPRGDALRPPIGRNTGAA
ncbi:MAG TPA: CopL family metal-binding regulatory protein [Thermomonas sp.]|nr:CopL family metal-binding regulatory protein [Thermomonas sp.]